MRACRSSGLTALRGATAFARFHGVLALALALVIGGSIAALLLRRLLPVQHRGAIGRRWLHRAARLLLAIARLAGVIRTDLSAARRLGAQDGLVLVANHPSRLDALLLVACLPDLVCVTKASIRDHPLFGAALRLAGYPRQGGALRLARESRGLLDAGCPLLVFPHGTRGDDATLPLRPGFAAIALQARVAVQVVRITLDPPYLGPGWPLLRRPALPIRCRVELGRRFDAPGTASACPSATGSPARQLAEQVADDMRAGAVRAPNGAA